MHYLEKKTTVMGWVSLSERRWVKLSDRHGRAPGGIGLGDFIAQFVVFIHRRRRLGRPGGHAEIV